MQVYWLPSQLVRNKKDVVIFPKPPNPTTHAPNPPLMIFFLHADKSSSAPEDNLAELAGPVAIPESVSNPTRSKVKGRKKEKRLKKGMNIESKRQNKCGICRLTGHNAAKCSSKKEIEDGKLGA